MTLARPTDPHAYLAAFILQHSAHPEREALGERIRAHAGVEEEQEEEEAQSQQPPKDDPRRLRLIIAGAPCSGKGAQSEWIKAKYGVYHLSTGDLLRSEIAAGSRLGREAKAYMDKGLLIPDSLICGVVANALRSPEVARQGWLLDGFPRTSVQAKALAEAGIEADLFLHLRVPDPVLVRRVTGRRLDPVTGQTYHVEFDPPPPEVAARVVQRSDDTEEKIVTRLRAYHDAIDAIAAHYAHCTVDVNGDRKKHEVTWDVMQAIEAVREGDDLSKLRVSSPTKQQQQQHRSPSPAASATPVSPNVSAAVAPATPSTSSAPLRLIIAGPPCSGKGTQCEWIKATTGVYHLSTGDLLRSEIEAGSKLGLEAKQYMDKGLLIPDSLICGVVASALQSPEVSRKGWLLDGFPRTAVQAKALADAGIHPDLFLQLCVPDAELVRRVTGRRLDPVSGRIYHVEFDPPPADAAARVIQRSDDTEEKIATRLRAYHDAIDAIATQYAHCCVIIDGHRAKDAVTADIAAAIKRAKPHARHS